MGRSTRMAMTAPMMPRPARITAAELLPPPIESEPGAVKTSTTRQLEITRMDPATSTTSPQPRRQTRDPRLTTGSPPPGASATFCTMARGFMNPPGQRNHGVTPTVTAGMTAIAHTAQAVGAIRGIQLRASTAPRKGATYRSRRNVTHCESRVSVPKRAAPAVTDPAIKKPIPPPNAMKLSTDGRPERPKVPLPIARNTRYPPGTSAATKVPDIIVTTAKTLADPRVRTVTPRPAPASAPARARAPHRPCRPSTS